MTLAAGDRLGAYEVLAPLGAGGMGEVYRARDPKLGREVAIKVLPGGMASDPAARSRFEREAKTVAALSHPNVLAIHDFGSDQGNTYAVMELLEGESLDHLLARERIAWRKAIEIAAAVADGLAAGHAKGIVHRDVMPANVFVTADGLVKILDFGLAKQSPLAGFAEAETLALPDEPPRHTLTRPGTVMGTVGYMAPEQVMGTSADSRSDVFSLGCVLYEMLVGERAFRGATAVEVLAAILRDPIPELSPAAGAIPGTIAAVLRRCLEKKPDERFQSARDLAFALRESVSRPSESIAATALPLRAPGLDRRWLVGWGLVAVVATALVLTLRRPTPRFPAAPAARTRVQSLAVLPLAKLSGNHDEEYFADGMTEQLIAELAAVRNLRVTSHASSMSYKGRSKPLVEIARELGVDAVVEGSVARHAGRIKVSAQLIDAATDSHLWVRSYERGAGDIVTLQAEIA